MTDSNYCVPNFPKFSDIQPMIDPLGVAKDDLLDAAAAWTLLRRRECETVGICTPECELPQEQLHPADLYVSPSVLQRHEKYIRRKK
jgi:hypothetical protein